MLAKPEYFSPPNKVCCRRGAVAAEMLLSRTLLAEKTQGCIGKLLLAGDA